MSATTLYVAHRSLCDASLAIGSVCEMAGWASAQIAAAVASTGKTVDELTVGELRQLITEHGKRVREIYA